MKNKVYLSKYCPDQFPALAASLTNPQWIVEVGKDTDASIALQKALADLKPHGTIYLDGIFLLTDSFVLTKPVNFIGFGLDTGFFCIYGRAELSEERCYLDW